MQPDAHRIIKNTLHDDPEIASESIIALMNYLAAASHLDPLFSDQVAFVLLNALWNLDKWERQVAVIDKIAAIYLNLDVIPRLTFFKSFLRLFSTFWPKIHGTRYDKYYYYLTQIMAMTWKYLATLDSPSTELQDYTNTIATELIDTADLKVLAFDAAFLYKFYDSLDIVAQDAPLSPYMTKAILDLLFKFTEASTYQHLALSMKYIWASFDENREKFDLNVVSKYTIP